MKTANTFRDKRVWKKVKSEWVKKIMGLKKDLKKVFFDFEFTGEHQFTTPVSLGMVGEANEELYITFKDYNKIQVTDWLRENVISKIDENKSISKEDGLIKITEWLNNYRNDGYISLISLVKQSI